MPDPLDALLSRVGKSRETISPKSSLGKKLHGGGVANTEEVKRILSLPYYRWQEDTALNWMGKELISWLGKPTVESCKRRCGHPEHDKECPECRRAFFACPCHGEGHMAPRLLQVAALQAIHDFGGLLGAIRVGGGKTLITYLAGPVCGAERVLLFLKASLIQKTRRDFKLLSRHWHGPKRIHLMSYELLSRDRGLAELYAYRPDLVLADEAQKLKNTKAACTKRIHGYLTKENKDAKYVDLSGTTTKRSILEYHHRINWALPDGLQPLPRKYPEAKSWADAIDEGIKPGARLMPGALLQLCTLEELSNMTGDPRKEAGVKIIRQAYARRLLSTPGVCGTEDQFDGAMSIQIQAHEYDVSEAVISAFDTLRCNWATPDGHQIDQASSLWRHARELAQGFFYRWDPPPPKEWLQARREWSTAVREIIKNYRDLDTPMVAARAVDKGRIPWAAPILNKWRAIKPTFEPKTVPEWIDDSALHWAAKWAERNTGIIWVHETAFGMRLSKETGLAYYAAGGRYNGRMIEDETKTCIASIEANKEGRNLQQFSQALVMSCPPGGDVWEQMLGRMHRDGQQADEITYDVPLICYEQWDVFRKARYEARYIEDTTRQAQKLNFADIEVQEELDIASRHMEGDPLWCKDNASFFERS